MKLVARMRNLASMVHNLLAALSRGMLTGRSSCTWDAPFIDLKPAAADKEGMLSCFVGSLPRKVALVIVGGSGCTFPMFR